MRRQSQRRNTSPLLPLIALVVGAFALRLMRLGAASLWYDETVSMLLAGKPIPALVAHTARDIHPPFYYLLLHWWTGLTGRSEFSAAYMSLAFGLLLVPATFSLARRLIAFGHPAGASRHLLPITSAFLVAISPYNIWYSQEVRMYTLGAFLCVLNGYSAWRLLTEAGRGRQPGPRRALWVVFVLSAALGLYTLYYFAFFLIFQAVFILAVLLRERLDARPWLQAAGATLILWAPWFPIAWRQATNPPVPPWREFTPLWTVLRDSFAALAFGQSAPPSAWWPWLLVALALSVLGMIWARGWKLRLFLLGATWAPVALIYLLSVVATPLFHVRYVFTYSPYFYLLLAAGLAALRMWLSPRVAGAAVVGVLVLWAGLSGRSLWAFWNDPAYNTDDFRGAMSRLEELWRPGDALLVNAGYVYPVVSYYFDGPILWQGRLTSYAASTATQASTALESHEAGLVVLQSGSLDAPPDLGWGLPESDFYATTTAETESALNRVASRHPRLWVLRAYDTVTDPEGHIRTWLQNHATLFYDELLTGETNARLQGWLLPPSFQSAPERRTEARFGEGLRLDGFTLNREQVRGGEELYVRLAITSGEAVPDDLHLALGLMDAAGRQWAVADFQPIGPTLPLATIPAGAGIELPLRLTVPPGLPPGNYELRLKAYSSEGVLPVSGDSAASTEQARLAVVAVLPTPASTQTEALSMPVPVKGDFEGRLTLLGARIGNQTARVGETIEVELLWQAGNGLRADDDLRPTLRLDGVADDGGVVTRYPTSAWQPGQIVRDLHQLPIPPDASPGRYPIQLEVLAPAEGRSLVATGLVERKRQIRLGEILVEDRPRSFAAPDPAVKTDAQFGPAIELVGYDLASSRIRPGEALQLTLYWHALSRPAGRYKIFTHLIDPNGQLQGQRDVEPGEGTAPTNGWARGEYITMTLTIPVAADAPAGHYDLRLGFYDPITGERVEVFGAEAAREERYLRLLQVEVGE